MFCPQCGQRQILSDSRFCPNCGVSIAKLREVLSTSVTADAKPSGSEDGSALDKITFDVPTPIEEVEKRMILATLKKLGGNKTQAAQLLKISLKTLHNKLTQYRMSGRNF